MILESLAANAAFVVVALALGEPLLRLVERAVGGTPAPVSASRLGAALLVGFGGCALAGVLLAALHLFRWPVFAACAVVLVVSSRGALCAYGGATGRVLVGARRADPVVLLAGAVSLVVVVAQWLAALAPPEATDELAYHLPEARTLADTHALHLTLGSDTIYGNLPTLAETLYGEALTLRGTELVHLVHLSILLAFVLLAAAVVRSLWGARAAALAAAGLLLEADLLYNATTGYVDAAGIAFEGAALLLLARWAVRRDPRDAAVAAVLLGFALDVKYTSGATAVLCAALVGWVSLRRREARLPLRLTGLIVLVCAYWYGKNLVRFGNPVYPFALGHPGISDATYSYFVGTVHAFGPRTLHAFVRVPTRLAGDATVTGFLGFALAPLALAARGTWRAAALLLAFVLLYATYWFWLGSHQTRFLLSAVAIAIVLAAVALGAARGRAGLLAAVLVALAALVVGQASAHSFNLHLRAAADRWLDTPKSRYALGLESPDAYLHRYFGCQVDAVQTLAARGLRGGVALADLDPPPTYPVRNALAPIHVTATTPGAARAQLRDRGVRFALAQGTTIEQLSTNPNARPLLAAARPFWHEGACTLYRLDLGRPQ